MGGEIPRRGGGEEEKGTVLQILILNEPRGRKKGKRRESKKGEERREGESSTPYASS